MFDLSGWLQVESMAVLGTSDNPVEAKKFVQWMQSPAVQQQIFTNQFMFPVIHNDGLQPACWQRVVDDGSRQPILSGSNVSLLNYRLPPKYLQEHLPRLLMQFKVEHITLARSACCYISLIHAIVVCLCCSVYTPIVLNYEALFPRLIWIEVHIMAPCTTILEWRKQQDQTLHSIFICMLSVAIGVLIHGIDVQ